MGFIEIPGGQEVLVHEDGRVRLGLRNLPKDSQRLKWPTDKDGNRKNVWPELVIKTSLNEPDRKMLLPEAVLKAHGKIPPHVVCEQDDFTPKNGSRTRMSDSAIKNLEYDVSGKAKKPDADGAGFIDKPENRKKKEDSEPKGDDSENAPAAPHPDDEGSDEKGNDVPKANPDAKNASEGLEKLKKGSAELNAKEAIQIIEDYDFEELRDLAFYSEDDRDRGPRTTVTEAWEKKVAEYEESQG